MPKTNPVIAEAQQFAKKHKFPVVAWGDENIVFTEPKSAEKLSELVNYLKPLGLNFTPDAEDAEAGVITFTTLYFKKKAGRKKPPIVIILLICISTLGLMAFSFNGFYDTYQSYQAINWKSTQAYIKSAYVQDYRHRGRSYFQPKITYTYTANENGQSYTNSRIEFINEPSYLNLNDANSFLANHIKNQRITIFYDPHHPAHAVIKKEINYRNLFYPVMSLFIASFCVQLLYKLQFNIKKNNKR